MVLKKGINKITKESPQPKKQTKTGKSKSPKDNHIITTKTGDKPVINTTTKKTKAKNELILHKDFIFYCLPAVFPAGKAGYLRTIFYIYF